MITVVTVFGSSCAGGGGGGGGGGGVPKVILLLHVFVHIKEYTHLVYSAAHVLLAWVLQSLHFSLEVKW